MVPFLRRMLLANTAVGAASTEAKAQCQGATLPGSRVPLPHLFSARNPLALSPKGQVRHGFSPPPRPQACSFLSKGHWPCPLAKIGWVLKWVPLALWSLAGASRQRCQLSAGKQPHLFTSMQFYARGRTCFPVTHSPLQTDIYHPGRVSLG